MQNFDPSTLFIGRIIHYMARVDSTNLVLKDLVKNGNVAEGTMVVADEQTRGRGRQGRSWFGSPGLNIYSSVLLKPRFLPVDQQANINFCVSLAIADTLREFIPYARIHIKWPNDVMLNRGKVAGILIESTIGNRLLDYVVAGIGINVNERSFPDELHFATSMVQQSGQVFRITDVIGELCRKLEYRYQQLLTKDGRRLQCREYNVLLYSREKKVVFNHDGKEMEGVVKEVDCHGRLSIQLEEGLKKFNQGEIKISLHGISN